MRPRSAPRLRSARQSTRGDQHGNDPNRPPRSTARSSTQFVFRAVERGRRDAQRRARRDGRQARPLPGDGGRGRADAAPSSRAAPGVSERYVREWLNAQAAGGYVEYDPATARYTLPPEQARRADRRGRARPTCRASSRSRSARASTRRASPRPPAAATGVGWHEHDHDVFEGCERFFRPGYNANLIAVVAARRSTASSRSSSAARQRRRRRLRARRLDDPDGAGVPELDVRRLRLPRGLDRDRARARGRRRASPTACASRRRPPPRIRATGYDLVTMFDCLHDMGDPVGAARHVRETLAADGTWMIVEPIAGDRVEDNLNPVGRVYYGFSTLLCTPGVAVAGGRARARRAGRRGADPRRRRRRRLHALPPRGRDAVQPRVRGAAVTIYDRPAWGGATPGTPARERRTTRASSSATASASTGSRYGHERADDPAPAHLVDRALAPCGRRQIPYLAAPLPRGHVRRPRQRALGPPGRDRAPTTRREFVADALAVLDAAGIEPACVVGLSLAALRGAAARRPASRARRRACS